MEVIKENRDLVKLLAEVETVNRDLQLQIKRRKETEQELMKFQRLYDTVVHNFPEGIIGVLNKKMEYVLVDGKDLNEIDLPALGLTTKESDKNDNTELAQTTIANIKKAFEGESVFFEVKANDRYYSISAVPLLDAKNSINEILCVFKNVTEKNRMQQGLLKALEKEKELGELKSRFVTMACHEFKTPLATILSSTFLLENYTDGDYEREKLVHTNRIKRSVNNLTMILNDFLLLDKLNENRVTMVRTIVDLPAYLRELISELDPAKQNGQVFGYHHIGDKHTVYIDEHVLWSIINNLISNAMKYSGKNDTIDITTEITNDLVVIKVKDHGIGIPEDEHKNIFGLFFRARNAVNFEGTGLGLYIVQKNVKLLDGAISFTSQMNIGTEFIVELPLENVKAF